MYLIEKITPKNYTINIQPLKGIYSIYKDKDYIPFKKKSTNQKESYYFPLPKLVFIGENFKIDNSFRNTITLFSVINGSILIPFYILHMSDIRHLKLPAYINIDELPVQIYYFDNPNIGILSNSIRQGQPYFLLEPKFNRNIINKLQKQFPTAITIIYRSDRVSFVHSDFLNRDIQSTNSPYQALVDDTILNKTQDPVFTTRIYIYQKNWQDLESLPYKIALTQDNIKLMNMYLRIELNRQVESNEVDIEMQYFVGLFGALEICFSLQLNKVNDFLSRKNFTHSIGKSLNKVLIAQKQYLSFDIQGNLIRSFFDDVLILLKGKNN